ncbi:hypothetical protein TIFTF001_046236 [Ficus carica]|uniref:Uncharacterized protein n=1 Tax=Ficus carica TaxID=3494 RepID=A0AA87Z479_FICCA|nr:hypothetical protein TIFTF001_046234 [Ficus carica]GMN28447.1 hypothetical protein TIFTF001_046236 [Ficus carica]
MDEHEEQEIREENPASTGSRDSHRPPRGRGGRQRRPTQTKILAGSVQDLNHTVQVLMEALRGAQDVQPRQQQEATESTPSRPPRSAGRRLDLPPTRDRSHRSQHGDQEREQRGEELGRERSGSRRTGMTRSDAADPREINQAGARPDDQDNQVDQPEENPNVRASAASVFDQLGRPAIYRRLGR